MKGDPRSQPQTLQGIPRSAGNREGSARRENDRGITGVDVHRNRNKRSVKEDRVKLITWCALPGRCVKRRILVECVGLHLRGDQEDLEDQDMTITKRVWHF